MNKTEYQLPRTLTIGEGIQLFHEVIQVGSKHLYSFSMELLNKGEEFGKQTILDNRWQFDDKLAVYKGKRVDYNLAIISPEILSLTIDHMNISRHPRHFRLYALRISDFKFINYELEEPLKLRLLSSSQQEIDKMKQGLDALVQRVMV